MPKRFVKSADQQDEKMLTFDTEKESMEFLYACDFIKACLDTLGSVDTYITRSTIQYQIIKEHNEDIKFCTGALYINCMGNNKLVIRKQ